MEQHGFCLIKTINDKMEERVSINIIPGGILVEWYAEKLKWILRSTEKKAVTDKRLGRQTVIRIFLRNTRALYTYLAPEC